LARRWPPYTRLLPARQCLPWPFALRYDSRTSFALSTKVSSCRAELSPECASVAARARSLSRRSIAAVSASFLEDTRIPAPEKRLLASFRKPRSARPPSLAKEGRRCDRLRNATIKWFKKNSSRALRGDRNERSAGSWNGSFHQRIVDQRIATGLLSRSLTLLTGFGREVALHRQHFVFVMVSITSKSDPPISTKCSSGGLAARSSYV
jgi:hypothetical protein